jgi:hypothetical protein
METNNNRVFKVVIELDAILDTRIPLIHKMAPALTETILCSGYKERIDDRSSLCGIDYLEFVEAYNNREKDLLLGAFVTSVPKVVYDGFEEMMNESIESPISLFPEVLINTFPYDLGDEEIKVLSESVFRNYPIDIPVKMINISYDDLNPKWLRENKIDRLILYGSELWLYTQFKNDAWGPVKACPNIELVAPMLITADNKGMELDEVLKRKHDGMNVFEFSEKATSLLIKLTYYKASMFTASNVPDNMINPSVPQ